MHTEYLAGNKQVTQRSPRRDDSEGFVPISFKTPQAGRLVRLLTDGKGIGVLTNEHKRLIDGYNRRRAAGYKPANAWECAKNKERADEAGIEVMWTYDPDPWKWDGDGPCCKVRERIDAGYTNGRSYERWVFRARYGRYPRPHEQAGEYDSSSRLEREHEDCHEVLACHAGPAEAFGDYEVKDYYAVESLWGIWDPGDSPYGYRMWVSDDQIAEALHEYDEREADAIASWAAEVDAQLIAG